MENNNLSTPTKWVMAYIFGTSFWTQPVLFTSNASPILWAPAVMVAAQMFFEWLDPKTETPPVAPTNIPWTPIMYVRAFGIAAFVAAARQW